MKIKKEYIILLALIVALSAYLAFRNSDRSNYRLPKAPAISKDEISKIELDKKDASIVLKKKGEGWEIAPQGYAADAEKVKGLLGTLDDLTLTALISESKDYSRYDLDQDKKIRVRAWAGDKLLRDFDVGKPAPTYRHTFVKLAGDDRVYHARENFKSKFDQTVSDLRDKTVLSFDRGDIKEISLKKGEEALALTRKEIAEAAKKNQEGKDTPPPKKETVWENAEGARAKTTEVTDVLSELSKLRCEKYMAGEKADLKDPIFQATLKGDQDYSLSIFAKKDKEDKSYPAVSSENAYPFLLPDWRVEKIMKDPKALLVKAETEKKAETPQTTDAGGQKTENK